MHVLIAYGTTEGQTAKIAKQIAEVIRIKGHEVSVQCGDELALDFSQFDACIVGGSIHMDRFQSYLKKFVVEQHEWLNSIPSAFFTVCMAAHSKNEKERKQAHEYGEKFVKEAQWQPIVIGTFSGAIAYTKYNFITRFIMKLIAKREGGSTDTSKDHEYTDWEEVARFTEKFVAKLSEVEKV